MSTDSFASHCSSLLEHSFVWLLLLQLQKVVAATGTVPLKKLIAFHMSGHTRPFLLQRTA